MLWGISCHSVKIGESNCECGIGDVKIRIESWGGAQTTVPRVKLVCHNIQKGFLMLENQTDNSEPHKTDISQPH